MVFLILLSLSLFKFTSIDVLSYLATPVGFLHHLCVSHSYSTTYDSLYASLLCGESLVGSKFDLNFKKLGVIHFFVVSGAHLAFFEICLNGLPKKWRSLQVPILILFCLTAGLQPPVVRALFKIIASRTSRIFGLFLRSDQSLAWSIVFCLLIAPDWINRISLHLSWCATLTIILTKNHKPIYRSLIVYISILPVLSTFTVLNPATVVSNTIIAPIFTALLFPISILGFVFPFLRILTDGTWETALSLIGLFAEEMEINPTQSPRNWNFYYVLILHFFVSICITNRNRKWTKVSP